MDNNNINQREELIVDFIYERKNDKGEKSTQIPIFSLDARSFFVHDSKRLLNFTKLVQNMGLPTSFGKIQSLQSGDYVIIRKGRQEYQILQKDSDFNKTCKTFRQSINVIGKRCKQNNYYPRLHFINAHKVEDESNDVQFILEECAFEIEKMDEDEVDFVYNSAISDLEKTEDGNKKNTESELESTMKITYEINPDPDYMGEMPDNYDWDEKVIEFNDIINEHYPNVKEIRFDGINSQLNKSIVFDVEADIRTVDDEKEVEYLVSTLEDLWSKFDIGEYPESADDEREVGTLEDKNFGKFIDFESFYEDWYHDAMDVWTADELIDQFELEKEADLKTYIHHLFEKLTLTYKEIIQSKILYRAIGVDDTDQFIHSFHKEGVGTHWSYEKEGAIPYYNLGEDIIIMTAVIDPSSINWNETYRKAFSFEYGIFTDSYEAEIELFKNEEITIINIDELDGKIVENSHKINLKVKT